MSHNLGRTEGSGSYDPTLPIRCRCPDDHARQFVHNEHCILCELELLRALVKPAADVCAHIECFFSSARGTLATAALHHPDLIGERRALEDSEHELGAALKTLYVARSKENESP